MTEENYAEKLIIMPMLFAASIAGGMSLLFMERKDPVDNMVCEEEQKPLSEKAGEATGNYLYSTWDTIQEKREERKAQEEVEEQRQKEIEEMEEAVKKKNEGPSLLDKIKSKFTKDGGEQEDGDNITTSE